MLVVIIIGGIYSGIFTATEAAAMAAVYSFFGRRLRLQGDPAPGRPAVLLRSANMSAMLLYIITNAALFSFILTNENIPHRRLPRQIEIPYVLIGTYNLPGPLEKNPYGLSGSK